VAAVRRIRNNPVIPSEMSAATTSATGPGSTLQVGGAAAAPVDVPNEKVLTHAAKIAVERDMPILLDYYADTKSGKAFLGEDVNTKEKSLVKSAEEYTSPIQKVFGTKTEYIIVTENSIYIVSGAIKKKNISMGNGAPAAITN
jgi:hypothetical protein